MNIIKCSSSENGFGPFGMESGTERNKMAQFIGRVVGTKMQKTAKVEVIRLMLHPLVLKVSVLLCKSTIMSCYVSSVTGTVRAMKLIHHYH